MPRKRRPRRPPPIPRPPDVSPHKGPAGTVPVRFTGTVDIPGIGPTDVYQVDAPESEFYSCLLETPHAQIDPKR
jgi:hypothetical protein